MGLSTGDNISRVGRGYRPMAEINVTPMVDVMLVLLIIFMVTSPMMISGVNVDLPETDASQVTVKDEPLTISIKADGKIYIQEAMVSFQQLIPRLQAISGENSDLRIFVRGDKRLDYGKVMAVVGAINGSGFKKVALITESQ